jgi:ABC-type oligopeptide transport system substrate-binding subunit
MKKNLASVFLYVFALAILSSLFSSCSTSKGSQYQNHLKHRHVGSHYLNSDNGGCGWSK